MVFCPRRLLELLAPVTLGQTHVVRARRTSRLFGAPRVISGTTSCLCGSQVLGHSRSPPQYKSPRDWVISSRPGTWQPGPSSLDLSSVVLCLFSQRELRWRGSFSLKEILIDFYRQRLSASPLIGYLGPLNALQIHTSCEAAGVVGRCTSPLAREGGGA